MFNYSALFSFYIFQWENCSFMVVLCHLDSGCTKLSVTLNITVY